MHKNDFPLLLAFGGVVSGVVLAFYKISRRILHSVDVNTAVVQEYSDLDTMAVSTTMMRVAGGVIISGIIGGVVSFVSLLGFLERRGNR